ncbi:IclR family transcriptional regulator domain-containing protein [Halobellus sp. GM3]|uniref:IclR family transcriptional regulator domain-containing protein n=1 Tax=Halobellus sp. GM3 TaxID=3458410 RepID=UPI00403DE19F
MSILEVIRESNGANLEKVAADADIAKSTAFRHLSTLEKYKFVVKKDGRYKLGLGLLDWGEAARSQQRVYQIAKSKVDSIAAETGENVWILVEEGGSIVFIYLASGEYPVETYAGIGKRVEPHLLASGKAILAFTAPDRADEIISQIDFDTNTENSIDTEAQLREQLDTIREERIAYNFQEYAKGLQAVATPVLDHQENVCGAIGIFGPANQLTEEKMRGEYAEILRSASTEIELADRYG